MQTVIFVFSQNSPTRTFWGVFRGHLSPYRKDQRTPSPHCSLSSPLRLPHPSSLNLPILIHDSNFNKGDIQEFSSQTKEAPRLLLSALNPAFLQSAKGLSNTVISTKEGENFFFKKPKTVTTCDFLSSPPSHPPKHAAFVNYALFSSQEPGEIWVACLLSGARWVTFN